MKAIFYILGAILFLNYRIIYSVLFHKTVFSFGEFMIRKETDKAIPLILTIDVLIVSFWLFSFWTALIIIFAVLSLNLIVSGLVKLKKRLWK